MPEPVADIVAWLKTHESFCWWLTAASAATFIGTLVLVPLLLIRMPPDYFIRKHDHRLNRHPLFYWSVIIGKNILGGTLLLAGTAMLVLPGQGIITILLGISLLNFPGKRRLEKRLVALPGVLAAVNKIRQRAKQPPLLVPGLE